MADEIEGRIIHPGAPVDGPRCRLHEPMVGTHGVWGGDYPAHTWSNAIVATCLRCSGDIAKGDLYLCDYGGIIHAEPCKPPALRGDHDA